MQITGQILNVAPRMLNGYPETFTTENGQFFVFEMAIQQPSGPLVGHINAKSPQYPLQNGEQITVAQSTDQSGLKFTKINEGYGNQQQPPQQGNQQPPQNYPQPQQQPPPPQQRPPQDNVQDRIAFAQAYNRANDEYIADKIKEEQIKERTQTHYNVLKTRQFPAQMCEYTPPPQQEPQNQFDGNNELKGVTDNPPFSPTDDIPF